MNHPAGRPLVCPVLIGRDEARGVLREWLDRETPHRIVTLSGEAGIGKTRLATEAREMAAERGWRCLEGNCFEVDQLAPFAPFLDLLGMVSAATAGDPLVELAPPAMELIDRLESVSREEITSERTQGSEARKRQIFEEITRFFVEAASARPLLVIIEDLHWSDESSLELILHLSHKFRRTSAHLLLTYRTEEKATPLESLLAELDRARAAVGIELNSLTPDQVREMVSATLGAETALPRGLIEFLGEVAEGNPFVVEEFLRSALEDREGVDGAETLALPRSVQDVVRKRTDGLTPEGRRALDFAAVVGRRFDFDLLLNVLDTSEEELLESLRELVEAQLVTEVSPDRFSFRHELTRYAIYQDLLGREAKKIHLRVAETLEEEPGGNERTAGDLARHFYEAGEWERALEYAEIAGRTAHGLYSPRAAVEHLTRAVRSAASISVAVPAEIHTLRGLAHEALGDFDEAERDHELALQGAREQGDGRAEWQALHDLGMLWTGRDLNRAEGYLRDALSAARQLQEPRLEARSLNRLGNWHMNRADMSQALQCHEKALETFENKEDETGVAATLDLLGVTTYSAGDLLRAREFYSRAVSLFRRSDDRPALVNALGILSLLGANYHADVFAPAAPFDECLKYAEEALGIAREIAWRPGEAFALANLGSVLCVSGSSGRGLPLLRESVEVAEEIEHWPWVVRGHLFLGAAYSDLFEHVRSIEEMTSSVELAEKFGLALYGRGAAAMLAAAMVRAGSLDEAARFLDRVEDIGEAKDPMTTRLAGSAQAELWLEKGEPAKALDLIEGLMASTPGTNDRGVPRLALLRAQALTALDREGAQAAVDEVLELAEWVGNPHVSWRARAIAADLYARGGDREAARGMAQDAWATVESLAEGLDDDTSNTFLTEAAERVPGVANAVSEASDELSELTPREREVAALMARGLANKEIAEELVISVGTVETHVKRVLRKLDLRSRAQVAALVLKDRGKGANT